jgi:hypothetical protein
VQQPLEVVALQLRPPLPPDGQILRWIGGTGMAGLLWRALLRNTCDRSFAASMRSPISGGSALMKPGAMVSNTA